MPRRHPERPGLIEGDELSENYSDWRRGVSCALRKSSQKVLIRTYALSTTALVQFIEYDRTRSFPISLWTPSLVPLLD